MTVQKSTGDDTFVSENPGLPIRGVWPGESVCMPIPTPASRLSSIKQVDDSPFTNITERPPGNSLQVCWVSNALFRSLLLLSYPFCLPERWHSWTSSSAHFYLDRTPLSLDACLNRPAVALPASILGPRLGQLQAVIPFCFRMIFLPFCCVFPSLFPLS